MSDNPWDEFPANGFLRDSDNQFVGRLERRSDGNEWITQYPDNQAVGRYDPHTNQTWDVYGNFVGFGNLLTALLRRR
jgi:hypothetical protein